MFMPKAAEIPRARVLLIDGEGQVWSHGGGGRGKAKRPPPPPPPFYSYSMIL
jgi:hypothetical protein